MNSKRRHGQPKHNLWPPVPKTTSRNGQNSKEASTRDSRISKRPVRVRFHAASITHAKTNLYADTEIASVKTNFSLKFNSTLWILTTGLQFFVGWWYRKSAVFYLPQGWFGPLTWWLGLPWAPRGSVSCGIWQMACRRIILVLERTVKDFACESLRCIPLGRF